jgi:hypothetical protein
MRKTPEYKDGGTRDPRNAYLNEDNVRRPATKGKSAHETTKRKA